MSTHRRFVTLTAVLGASALLTSAEPAQAQFGPRFGFAFQYGIGPNVVRNPYLPGLPTVPGQYVFRGYTVSGVGAGGSYSLSLRFYNTASVVTGGGYSPEIATLGSGYGSNRKVTAEQRSAIGQAQRNAKWDTGASATPDFDRWLKEAATRRESPDPKAVKEVPIDMALVEPPDEAILSGEALNRLAARVRELEKQGRKATPGLLAPELTTRIVFAGGAAAQAANLYRQPALRFPSPLRDPSLADLRADLEKAFAPVAKDAHAGKKTNPADVDRLLKVVNKAHDATRQLVADAPFADACEVCEFFAELEAATKYLKDERSVGVAGDDWSVAGATVAEVVRHQAKYGLRFGPVRSGDEAAYYSLHRGLLAYYVGLAQAK